MKASKSLLLLPFLATFALSSCAKDRSRGATVAAGATIGAVTGAILDKDGGVGGAIAGGVIGGAVGAAANNHQRQKQVDPYYYPPAAPSTGQVGRHTY